MFARSLHAITRVELVDESRIWCGKMTVDHIFFNQSQFLENFELFGQIFRLYFIGESVAAVMWAGANLAYHWYCFASAIGALRSFMWITFVS